MLEGTEGHTDTHAQGHQSLESQGLRPGFTGRKAKVCSPAWLITGSQRFPWTAQLSPIGSSLMNLTTNSARGYHMVQVKSFFLSGLNILIAR